MQLPSLLNSNFFWKTLPRIIFLKFIEISLFDLPFYLNPPLFPRTKNDGRRTHCVCICVCVALKQPCPTGGNGGIVSTNSPLAGFRPPMFRPPCKSRCEFRRWLKLASVAGGQRTWTQPCFARLSRVPARMVSRDSWLEYIGPNYLLFLLNDGGQNSSLEIFLTFVWMFRVIFIYCTLVDYFINDQYWI